MVTELFDSLTEIENQVEVNKYLGSFGNVASYLDDELELLIYCLIFV